MYLIPCPPPQHTGGPWTWVSCGTYRFCFFADRMRQSCSQSSPYQQCSPEPICNKHQDAKTSLFKLYEPENTLKYECFVSFSPVIDIYLLSLVFWKKKNCKILNMPYRLQRPYLIEQNSLYYPQFGCSLWQHNKIFFFFPFFVIKSIVNLVANQPNMSNFCTIDFYKYPR